MGHFFFFWFFKPVAETLGVLALFILVGLLTLLMYWLAVWIDRFRHWKQRRATR